MATRVGLGDLAKSAFTFPWAISLLGVQQFVNVVLPPAAGPVTATRRALDAVTAATRQRLDWREQTWQVAAALRRGLTVLAATEPPSIDSTALARIAAQPRLGPLVAATAGYVLPALGWLDSFRIASAEGAPLVQELANKLRVLRIVTDERARLHGDEGSGSHLRRLVDRVGRREPFARPWAVEALGAWHAARALDRTEGVDPEALLSEKATADLPPWSVPMLHAGMGMSFAGDALAGLRRASSASAVDKAVSRFARLCRRSSRRGCTGAAFESLGFVARTFHEDLVDVLDREIPQVDPELHGYFWHGVGRAMYFAPAYLLPSSNAPRGTIVDLEREAPDGPAYRNALSGIAWGMTLANMAHPDVVEVFLQYHGVLAAATDAFSSGVSSAVVMQRLTAPDDEDVKPFIDYEARSSEASAEAWRTMVAAPCRAALERRSAKPALEGAPGELFHHRPGPA